MKRKLIIFIGIITFILAVVSFGMGLYFNYISKPHNIFAIGIDVISDGFKNYFYSPNIANIGDNFSMENSISFDLDSEYYKRTSTSNSDDLKFYRLIKNLSNTKTNIILKHSKKEKTGYIGINQKLNDEELINSKIYVANATKYYFVNGILKNYVNDGTCNYFESLNDSSIKENIDYLYDFIVDSLKSNLKDSYFKTYDKSENINGNNKDVHQVLLEVDDKLIHDILNDILKDLKDDKKANDILTNIDPTFSKYELKTDKVFLNSNEKYTINVYTTKVLYKPLKYEIIHLNGDSKNIYSFEENGDNWDFFYIEDDKVKYKSSITFKNNNINAMIYNSTSEKVGELKLERDKNNIAFDFNFDDLDEKVDIVYYSKNEKKDNDVVIEKKISFKHILNKESKLSGNVLFNSKISKDVKIEEDVSNAVLEAKLTDEEKKKFNEKIDRVRERLEK